MTIAYCGRPDIADVLVCNSWYIYGLGWLQDPAQGKQWG